MTDDNVVPFKPKKLEEKQELLANVYVKDGLIGLVIKDGSVQLTPHNTIELCAILIQAMRVAIDITVKKE